MAGAVALALFVVAVLPALFLTVGAAVCAAFSLAFDREHRSFLG